MDSVFGPIDSRVDFDVAFEPSRSAGHKYVLNGDDGTVIGVVGKDFNCASHRDFFSRVQETITDSFTDSELDGATARYRVAREGGWAMCDMNMPSVARSVTTTKHKTTFGYRVVALHGIDGSCSNTCIFGAIDFFCTNGLISGSYDSLKRKNTSGFRLDTFIKQLEDSRTDFDSRIVALQWMADTSLSGRYERVKETLNDLMPERRAAKMLDLYGREVATRGENAFALVSAFTNYSSHNEDNGFGLRKTSNDNGELAMWRRESEVSSWLGSDAFNRLIAA